MHGYLALCLTTTTYESYSLFAFAPPINPELTLNYPHGATSAILATKKARFNEQKRQWEDHNTVMQALKNQLIEAVDKVYLQGIFNPVT